MTVLSEGKELPKPIRLFTEKDLQKEFTRITTGLNNAEDWEARVRALGCIQSLLAGDGLEFKGPLVAGLKAVQELVRYPD
jgi:hypothetical protein